ncbi:MAG: helix-turn-helix transcriptional regulator [Clostridia bacterium]|nr:helix-turn-helix transcriptional regulator [Clostridia bacterium]
MANKPKNNNLLIFGNNVKNYRLLKGITQEQLAESISISTVQLGRIESGKNACTIQMVLKLCAALIVTPNELFKGIECIPSSNDINVFVNSFVNSHYINSKETKSFLKHIIDYFPVKEVSNTELDTLNLPKKARRK